ncbi:N-acetyl-gamma-glutamyl-phosphate reductase [Formicincola oecophyllae]|uniref:N-acetyl-gamma-glutamyl-phosphate reductase n=1 Tax=Formicincola oecophyllae TaxID=2558361 RepID=A0A4Y6U9C7_9PROT|nr:N-acetyl-gamma-glutamyl-phosphate reductase [Formicincola oecophyllae]QDH13620.1 N-acetyl-gamma-glutamyl-phosphate reductase [Formicincola oecophyllae]
MTAQAPKIFIDGEAGTTGLGIRKRLAPLEQAGRLRLLAIDPAKRKEPAARQALMAEADITVLCLPDDAAREAVALADELEHTSHATKVLDASTAHRTQPGWVYGFPELAPGQEKLIAQARRVANPGCYATGAIALLHPLVSQGLVKADAPLSINAVSGYSGGGRKMMESHAREGGPAFMLYALGKAHKHLPEISLRAGLAHPPLFVPSVGHFPQGMVVSIPLHQGVQLAPGLGGAEVRDALARFYNQFTTHGVHVLDQPQPTMVAEGLAGRDDMELAVHSVPEAKGVVLTARLDNLGKGASGAACRNIMLMAGLENSKMI